MNEVKTPSYIMRHGELIMKVGGHIMNTSCKDEATIADNEDMEARILILFYKWLVILAGTLLMPFLRNVKKSILFLLCLQRRLRLSEKPNNQDYSSPSAHT